MSKVIWFESKDEGGFEPFFVVAEKITDATVMYEFKGMDSEEEGAELSIGLDGIGSRWRAVQFDSHDAADEAINSIAKIILGNRNGEYAISKQDGSWRCLEDE